MKVERQLLILAARGQLTSQERRIFCEILLSPLNWKEVLMEAGGRHSLAPLLLRHLSEVPEIQIPKEVEETLQGKVRQIAILNLSRQGDWLELLSEWGRAGIRIIPFKGPRLAWKLWGDLSMREYGDFDFWVHPIQAQAADEVLIRLGYLREVSLSSGAVQEFRKLHGEMPSWRRGATLVDVQTEVRAGPFRLDLVKAEFWDRVKQVNWEGVSFWEESPEDCWIALAVHASKHGWQSLEWVAGLGELIRRGEIEPSQRLLEKSRRMGVEWCVRGSMVVVDRVLGISSDSAYVKQLKFNEAESVIGSLQGDSVEGHTEPWLNFKKMQKIIGWRGVVTWLTWVLRPTVLDAASSPIERAWFWRGWRLFRLIRKMIRK